MTAFTIAVIVFAITALLLIQNVTIRITLLNGYRITVDYFFLTLTLRKGSTDRRNRRKKHRPSVSLLTRAVLRIIRSSKITVNKIKSPASSRDPFRSAVTRGGIISGIYPILNLLLSYAEITQIADGVLVAGQDTDLPTLDIAVTTELYNICFSGILLLYEAFKRRIKRSNV